jgi:transcriptional regulator of acetoin/glycerol metabolism
MSTGKEISLKSLPPDIRAQQPKGERISLPIPISMKEAEREIILATLRDTNGNRAAAAKTLGLGRKTLYRKMALHDIS